MNRYTFSLTKNQIGKKSIAGVTLIELLVVIVLLGIAITLVGPFTFKQIESSQARNEHLSLKRWLQKQSFYAFTSQSNITIKFDGKAIYSVVDAQISPLEQQLLNNTDLDTVSQVVSNQITNETNAGFNSLDEYLQYDGNQQQQLINPLIPPTHTFEFIFFEPQQLKINHHGYFNTDILTYRLRGVIVELNILDLIEGTPNES
ncbi:pilus assembly FimT family protein [Shewanella frigidimarina]|uniref:pilus assembly FimT family protein n=1 Tax=Shewanella frigidimarina TaxID=56812 RepID=UPI003D79D076